MCYVRAHGVWRMLHTVCGTEIAHAAHGVRYCPSVCYTRCAVLRSRMVGGRGRIRCATGADTPSMSQTVRASEGGRESAREGESEGGRERAREGESEGGRERAREGESEGGREGAREEESEGGREGAREEEREGERGQCTRAQRTDTDTDTDTHTHGEGEREKRERERDTGYRPTRCPVLTPSSAMLIQHTVLSAPYAMSGTGIPLVRYAMTGSDVPYVDTGALCDVR
eukprot:248009-Rhodomonas_salina.2